MIASELPRSIRTAPMHPQTSPREARERVRAVRETEPGADDLPAGLEAIAKERTSGAESRSVITSGAADA